MKWALYWSDLKSTNTHYDCVSYRMPEGTICLRRQEWSPKVSYVLPAKWEGIVRRAPRRPAVSRKTNDPLQQAFDDLMKAFGTNS